MDGLMKALQQVLPDGEVHNTVADALEQRLECFQKQFYHHWETLSGQERD
ncbi:hypothetical protein [Flagellimonas onchidii]|nr:hypothetical protein [Allomuricauda onchidii]